MDMKIKDILQKQGELYKNLTSNKTIQKINETIDALKLVSYENYKISDYEYKAIKGLEKLLGVVPVLVDKEEFCKVRLINNFEISIKNHKITYLRIMDMDLIYLPEQINNLKNLHELCLVYTEIQEIKNLDNLTNLQVLDLDSNKIQKIENLDNLTNLKKLELRANQVREIEGLQSLQNLIELDLSYNKIKEIKNLPQSIKRIHFKNNPTGKGIGFLMQLRYLSEKGIKVNL